MKLPGERMALGAQENSESSKLPASISKTVMNDVSIDPIGDFKNTLSFPG